MIDFSDAGQGCPGKILRHPGEGIRPSISSWPGATRPSTPWERLRRRRGYADQVRARRVEVIFCAPSTSHSYKKIFPGQSRESGSPEDQAPALHSFAGMTRGGGNSKKFPDSVS